MFDPDKGMVEVKIPFFNVDYPNAKKLNFISFLEEILVSLFGMGIWAKNLLKCLGCLSRHFNSVFRSPVPNKTLIIPQKEHRYFKNGVKILQIPFDGTGGNVTLSVVNSIGSRLLIAVHTNWV